MYEAITNVCKITFAFLPVARRGRADGGAKSDRRVPSSTLALKYRVGSALVRTNVPPPRVGELREVARRSRFAESIAHP
jgi:hypothetical protein